MPSTDFGAAPRIAADWNSAGTQRSDGVRPAATARSAASLAAAVHQLIDALCRSRLPRLATVRQRLQQAEASWDLEELDQALHQVHAASGAIDFLAGRGAGAQAERFRTQGAQLGAAARRFGNISLNFVGRHAAEAALARLLWIDLHLEAHAVDKRVRTGLEWLAEMESELALRRAATTVEVSLRALDELARRGHALENRLHLVQGLCGSARAARTLGDQAWAQRAVLCASLEIELRPASLALQQRLQPLLEAAGLRPLDPAELIGAIEARHKLEVAVARTGAELVQLQGLQQELTAQLAWMERKAARIA